MKTKYLLISEYYTKNIVVHKQFAVVFGQVKVVDAPKLIIVSN
jgi:hypothetical protein